MTSVALEKESAVTPPTSGALSVWFHDRWEVVQTQWNSVPGTIRSAWEQVGEHLRNALDLPTRDDLGKLACRLDEIEQRLASIVEAREAARAAASQPAVEAAAEAAASAGPAPKVKVTAEKRVRARKR